MPGGLLVATQHTYEPGQSPVQLNPSGLMIGVVVLPLPPTALAPPLAGELGPPASGKALLPAVLPLLPPLLLPPLDVPGSKPVGGSPAHAGGV